MRRSATQRYTFGENDNAVPRARSRLQWSAVSLVEEDGWGARLSNSVLNWQSGTGNPDLSVNKYPQPVNIFPGRVMGPLTMRNRLLVI